MSAREREVAVVTGGNRGLGLETCRQLARRGFRVVLTSRNEQNGAAAAERLNKNTISSVWETVLPVSSTGVSLLPWQQHDVAGHLVGRAQAVGFRRLA